jgi:uncharacterized protein (TIGR03067 family)
MSRAIGLCCAAIVAFVSPLAADEKSDDWKGLKGTWKVEKAVFMGTDSTEAFGTAILTMEDGKYVVAFAGEEDKGTVKLDASKKPKQMTIESTEGTNKGKTFPSIYELTGDTLKVCYALEGKDPPTAFESKTGTNTLFITYKRDKK